ncbi:MAG: tetratricopeptide repeat protein [Pseudomonadota bacterium]
MRRLLATLALLALGLPAFAGPMADRCRDDKGQIENAVAFCLQALRMERLDGAERAAVHLRLGDLFYTLRRTPQAIEMYDAAAAEDPSRVEIFIGRAKAHARLGDDQAALADYASALQLRPAHVGARNARGVFFLERDAPERAIEDFELALAADPDNGDLWFNRGLAARKLGRAGEAVRDFSAAIRANDGDAAAWLNRGLAQADNNPEQAISDMTAAIRKAPEYAEAFAERGRLREALGRTGPANQDFMRAFELGYQAEWLVERINNLRR